MNTFGCGQPYLLRRCCTCHFISGQRVACRSTRKSGTSSACPGLVKELNMRRREPHWECFCMYSIARRLVNPTYRSSSYPIAYSFVVLPLSVARWLQFSNHIHVPSAATFFGVSMFNLSGAVNVLLFLIVRPELLLFTRPELGESKEPAPSNASLRVLFSPHPITSEHSHTSTATKSTDEAFNNLASLSFGHSSIRSYV